MLANPRGIYDTGDEDTKTLITKTIFLKLYLDADPYGTITITGQQLANPSPTSTPPRSSHSRTPHQPPASPAST